MSATNRGGLTRQPNDFYETPVSAIDPILDMGRTAINVTGQALVPTIVAKRQGILDHAIYDGGESNPETA